MQAALACFSEDGFHQTGMADIVRRSGMSHGAVYGISRAKTKSSKRSPATATKAKRS
ncbi:MAG: helix-turn-helix domain-containing protein [Roseiarcus sp.]